MAINERLIDAAAPIARAIKPQEDIRRNRRVDQAIDSQGRAILKGRQFLELESPDGSVWRIRISNTGVLSAKKVTP